MDEKMIKKHLLDPPVGSYTGETWKLAYDTLDALIVVDPKPKQDSVLPSPAQVRLSIHLFERLLQEEQYRQRQKQQIRKQKQQQIQKQQQQLQDNKVIDEHTEGMLDSSKYESKQDLSTNTTAANESNNEQQQEQLANYPRVYTNTLLCRVIRQWQQVCYRHLWMFAKSNNHRKVPTASHLLKKQNTFSSSHIRRLRDKIEETTHPIVLLSMLDGYVENIDDNDNDNDKKSYQFRLAPQILSLIFKIAIVFAKLSHHQVPKNTNPRFRMHDNTDTNDFCFALADFAEQLLFRTLNDDNLSHGKIQVPLNSEFRSHYLSTLVSVDKLNHLIDAWSCIGHPERGEQLLDKIVAAKSSNRLHLRQHRRQQKQKQQQQQDQEVASSSSLTKDYEYEQYINDAQNFIPFYRHYPVPNILSYNHVLAGYSLIGDPHSAERLLFKLRQYQQQKHPLKSGFRLPEPDTDSLNIVLSSWERYSGAKPKVSQEMYNQNNHYSHDDDDAADRFARYQPAQPNLYTYSTTLLALASAGKTDKCYSIFKEMLANARRFKTSYNDANGNVLNEQEKEGFESRIQHTYMAILDAFAKAGVPEHAQQLHDDMYEEYMTDRHLPLKPRIHMYKALLEAYSRRLQEIASSGRNGTPSQGPTSRNTPTTTNSNHDMLLANAVKVFNNMEELYERGLFSQAPDNVTYNVLLSCFNNYCAIVSRDATLTVQQRYDELRSKVVEMERLLETMKVLSVSAVVTTGTATDGKAKKDCFSIFGPDFRTYSLMIQSWLDVYCLLQHDKDETSSSSAREAINRAKVLLWEVRKEYNNPERTTHPSDSNSLHAIVCAFRQANHPDIVHPLHPC